MVTRAAGASSGHRPRSLRPLGDQKMMLETINDGLQTLDFCEMIYSII